jgi:hypothetical protein
MAVPLGCRPYIHVGKVGISDLGRDSEENHAPPNEEEYKVQRQWLEHLKAEVGMLRCQIGDCEQVKDFKAK